MSTCECSTVSTKEVSKQVAGVADARLLRVQRTRMLGPDTGLRRLGGCVQMWVVTRYGHKGTDAAGAPHGV